MESEETNGQPTVSLGPMTEGQTLSTDSETPSFEVDEFQIQGTLGRGGFGTVYLAFDQVLQREVAVKIPHRNLQGEKSAVAEYLREARATASLDHPHIIPVYRAASTPEIPCYIVTKRIRGSHLSKWQEIAKPSYRVIAELLAKVADALDYAHRHKLVHRDVKPSNILIDDAGQPFVADFGLALRETDVGDRPVFVGTPAYMSPEQARGEGHRLDGRSDIFSLGVILYELLTGSRPFRASDRRGLAMEVQFSDPSPPQSLRSDVPSDLARIAMKALAKPVSERYQSADQMANDLRLYLTAEVEREPALSAEKKAGSASNPRQDIDSIVPKGLRSYERRDADFFPMLLPGPYDRDGLPESLRFWITRLSGKELEAGQGIPVGVIYGPSGCGKTSLVRAGIVPRLPSEIATLYLQSTREGTEEALAQSIQHRLPHLLVGGGEQANLVELFSALRRQRQERVVIFLDQFEQWLFARPEVNREPLTQALRQCDGTYVQCVLMVRDDFWMGITRLMRHLDIPIMENTNVRMVDLFDRRHARRVLALLGHAYGRLPAAESLTPLQEYFIDEAVDYLAVDGRVICVQLALLAEMLKSRPWEGSTALLGDGGTNLGTRFLEETFDADTSSRRIRMHSEGAHRILRALLPEGSSRIKGMVLTEDELRQTSGYRDPVLFRQLIELLDRELHLITPTEWNDESSLSESSISVAGTTGYQLTHDFLIAPIRQWTELRSRSTPEGKARLRLEEFTELYHARPRRQSLPSLGEYWAITKHVDPTHLSPAQARMLGAARSAHLRTLSLALSITLSILVGLFFTREGIRRHNAALETKAAMARLLDAELEQAIPLAERLRGLPEVTRMARGVLNEPGESPRQVRAAMLLGNEDTSAAELLLDYSLQCPADELVHLLKGFSPMMLRYRDRLVERWKQDDVPRGEALHLAALLTSSSQDQALLQEKGPRLLRWLLAENPSTIPSWAAALQGNRDWLIPLLEAYLVEPHSEDTGLNAMNLLLQLQPSHEALIKISADVAPKELSPLTDALLVEDREGAVALARKAFDEQFLESSLQPMASRPWGSLWWCIGSRSPVEVSTAPIPPPTVSRLHAIEAEVSDIAIIAHHVPAADLPSLDQELRAVGYRVAQVLLTNATSRHLLVLWLRDGAESRHGLEMTRDEALQTNQQNRKEGFIPDFVAPVFVDQSVRFNVVWIKPPPGSSLREGDLYLELDEEEHREDGWDALFQRGLERPRSQALIRQSDGRLGYSAIHWHLPVSFEHHVPWQLPLDEIDERVRWNPTSVPVSVRQVLDRGTGETPAASAIFWSNLPVEVKLTAALPRRDHARQTQQWFQDAYYPAAIDVRVDDQDQGVRFQSVWWRPLRSSSEILRKAHRLRNLALVCQRLGDNHPLEQLLANQEEPNHRGSVIPAIHLVDIEPQWLLERIERHPDLSLRRACAWSLAQYPAQAVSPHLHDRLQSLAQSALPPLDDPGLRSALLAVARAWDLPLEVTHVNPHREVLSTNGTRLICITPGEVEWCGSPVTEPGRDGHKEPLLPVHLTHAYAIGAHEVTVGQYQQYQPTYQPVASYSSSPDAPVVNVSFFDAMRYCRWVSEQEGFPESEMCYPPMDQIGPGMRLGRETFDRTGYRLPTEAEWEIACRGASPSSRWFGFDPSLLQAYAWTAANSDYRLHEVMALLPNDYGLFDTLGNAKEWCQTTMAPYPREITMPVADPSRETLFLEGNTRMVTRGGAMLYQPFDARAAQRDDHAAESQRVYLSFRLTRTLQEHHGKD